MITTKIKNKANLKVIVVSIVSVSILILMLVISTVMDYYAAGVSIKGERVGFVESESELAALVDEVENELSRENQNANIQVEDQAIDLDIMAKPKEDVKMLSEQQLKEKLVSTDTVEAKVSAITVNGKPVLYVGSRADANSVLSAVKQKYTVKGQNVVAKFQEDVAVTTAAVDVNSSSLMSTKTAITYLLSGNEKVQKYKVKKDDTDWDIAKAHGMTEKDIQKANPDIDTDVIKEGDILNLSKIEPFVHYQVTATVSGKEKTKYKTKKIETDELYKGEKQVRTKGVKGESYVTKRAVYVNGTIKKADVLEEKVIKDPKTRVLVVGDKERSEYDGGSSSSSGSDGGGSYIGGNGSLSNPLRSLNVSSPFGSRWGRLHAGIDFSGSTGTPIYAAASGTVISSGWNGGYGNAITISHGNGLVTLYGHCSALYVSDGEHVSRGEKIAAVGSTGNSTGSHLHFEVRRGGTPVNPWNYL